MGKSADQIFIGNTFDDLICTVKFRRSDKKFPAYKKDPYLNGRKFREVKMYIEETISGYQGGFRNYEKFELLKREGHVIHIVTDIEPGEDSLNKNKEHVKGHYKIKLKRLKV